MIEHDPRLEALLRDLAAESSATGRLRLVGRAWNMLRIRSTSERHRVVRALGEASAGQWFERLFDPKVKLTPWERAIRSTLEKVGTAPPDELRRLAETIRLGRRVGLQGTWAQLMVDVLEHEAAEREKTEQATTAPPEPTPTGTPAEAPAAATAEDAQPPADSTEALIERLMQVSRQKAQPPARGTAAVESPGTSAPPIEAAVTAPAVESPGTSAPPAEEALEAPAVESPDTSAPPEEEALEAPVVESPGTSSPPAEAAVTEPVAESPGTSAEPKTSVESPGTPVQTNTPVQTSPPVQTKGTVQSPGTSSGTSSGTASQQHAPRPRERDQAKHPPSVLARKNPFALLRNVARGSTDLRGIGPAGRREVVSTVAGGWAGRRLVQQILQAGAFENAEEALTLIAILPSASDRTWCLLDLAEHLAPSPASVQRLLAAAPSPAVRRRLEGRLRSPR